MDDRRKEIEKLVCERVLARADRDYDKADSIRDDLKSRFGTFANASDAAFLPPDRSPWRLTVLTALA